MEKSVNELKIKFININESVENDAKEEHLKDNWLEVKKRVRATATAKRVTWKNENIYHKQI